MCITHAPTLVPVGKAARKKQKRKKNTYVWLDASSIVLAPYLYTLLCITHAPALVPVGKAARERT